jgi:hypothetical protein
MNRRIRRIAAAGSAALALGLGSAAWVASSASAASDSPAQIPRCTPGQLGVWVNVDSGSGAAGSIYYHLDFTNTSTTTCHLYGYPGVSATTLNGTQLGDAAARDSSVPASYVNIPPDGTAYAILRYGNAEVSTSGCKPVNASLLRVYPPDDFSTRQAFFSLPACTVTGHTYLTITRVQPGT